MNVELLCRLAAGSRFRGVACNFAVASRGVDPKKNVYFYWKMFLTTVTTFQKIVVYFDSEILESWLKKIEVLVVKGV